MDYSAANTSLWNPIIQLGIMAVLILLANILRRKIKLIRNALLPTAVLAGFILLILRSTQIIEVDTALLGTLTFHGLAFGFIALSLRIPEKQQNGGALLGLKSGALISSTMLLQSIVGLIITQVLAYTIMPDLYKPSGILLSMGYGQGPGQASNIGAAYENLGMAGGKSFGLALAAAGYLCACIVGIIYLNVLNRKKVQSSAKEEDATAVSVDTFQNANEFPISDSLDRLSVQAALIVVVYLVSYLLIAGFVAALKMIAPALAGTVETLLWGFSFVIASAVAVGCRNILKGLRKTKWMHRQYQNNYLLNRIAGLAFDVMIVSAIASIDLEDITGYWLPFILLAVTGGVVTFFFVRYMCKKIYPTYWQEGFLSMYGMLTGTLSSGVLLLREADPKMETPASNNLITGSTVSLVLGMPMLILGVLAAYGNKLLLIVTAIYIVYFVLLVLLMLKAGKKRKQ